MTARVIGLDPGLANLGVAELTYDGHRCVSLTTRHEKSHPPANPTDDQTAARMTRMIRAAVPAGDPWLCEGCGYTHNPAPTDLVMVMLEGPSYGSTTPYQHDSAGLWWRLRSLLTSRSIPVGKCPPATLKLWAAGDGRASKHQMKLALDTMWPGVLARTEHEVDAALLALAAGQRLGWFDGHKPLRQAPQLAKMTWPKLPEQRPVPAVTT